MQMKRRGEIFFAECRSSTQINQGCGFRECLEYRCYRLKLHIFLQLKVRFKTQPFLGQRHCALHFLDMDNSYMLTVYKFRSPIGPRPVLRM